MLGNAQRIFLGPLILLAAVALASCRATSYPYQFEPSPAEVLIEAAPGGPQLARVLVAVWGAERLEKKSSGHPDLLVRVRVEAKGPGPVSFDPASATLLGPDLASFGPARVDGVTDPGVIEVPRDGARDLTLRFAFPRDGDLRMWRLTGVNLTFSIDTPAGARELSLSLSRSQEDIWWDYPTYYHPYPYGYPGARVGFGFAYSNGC
jgi:hypothetical protein